MDTGANLKLLIDRSRENDEEAFRMIFDSHIDRVFNYALSRTSDREAAQDIAQETFISFWKSLGSFDFKGEESFLGFIFIILKRKLARHYKIEARRKTLYSSLQKTEEPYYEESHEDYRYVFSALDSLSRKYQEIIKLRYWGELSFAEIGTTLGIRENAARVLHYRALKRLHTTYVDQTKY